jgi:hypothetical protein
VKKILVLLLLLALTGCLSNQPPAGLLGVYDGEFYTSPYGVISLDAKGWARLNTLQDRIENHGTSLSIFFKGKNGEEYDLLISVPKNALDSVGFLKNMYAKSRAEGKNVALGHTAQGDNCLTEFRLGKEQQAVLGSGFVNVLFIRGNVIYDISVKSKAMRDPAEASRLARKDFGELWSRASFRGHLPELETFGSKVDPRMLALVHRICETAKSQGCTPSIETAPEPIVRISASGKAEEMVLSIGLKILANKLVTTETVSCQAGDAQAMEKMRGGFFTALKSTANRDRIAYTRSDAVDMDLTLFPKKK